MKIKTGMILKNVDWEGITDVEVIKFNEGPDGIESVTCKRLIDETEDDISASEFLAWIID